MHALGRILLCLLGFFVAVCGAAIFIVAASMIGPETFVAVIEERLEGREIFAYAGIFLLTVIVVSIVGPQGAIPALAIIGLGEALRVRSLLYYMLAGGFLGPIVSILEFLRDPAPSDTRVEFMIVVIAAGFFAGFLYWLIAGRSAGLVSKDEVRATQRAVDRSLDRARRDAEDAGR
ncbi:MAG: hypothetical protein AAFX39_00820 [Pseudomonadota bacterium]